MKSTIMIKSSREFTKTIKRGKSVADKYLIIYIIPNNIKINKIGISIGKKVGKSVTRNHVKRLIKESYRPIEGNTKIGFNIVFIPREPSAEARLCDIKNSIQKLLRKLDLLDKEVI